MKCCLTNLYVDERPLLLAAQLRICSQIHHYYKKTTKKHMHPSAHHARWMACKQKKNLFVFLSHSQVSYVLTIHMHPPTQQPSSAFHTYLPRGKYHNPTSLFTYLGIIMLLTCLPTQWVVIFFNKFFCSKKLGIFLGFFFQ